MIREEYNYWLANIQNIGTRKIEALLSVFGKAEEVYRASRKELMTRRTKNTEGVNSENENTEYCGTLIKEADIEAIIDSREEGKIREKYAKLEKSGIAFVTKEDDDYPNKLRGIYGAPFALYVKGKLPVEGTKCLAVVGARDCTPYGKEMARYLSGAIAKEGIAIISGLARGIDAYAHEGALAAGGNTYGILGCGIDICYPKENINLYMELQKEGGIISEYAPGIYPNSFNFPMRNRIISGLSDGILVIEARVKSGSLITVDMGLEQGKDIYALPGKVSDRLSEGCNNLIKMGAKLVTSPGDILEDLLTSYEINKSVGKSCGNTDALLLSNMEKRIWEVLSMSPKYIEDIALETGQPLGELMVQLLAMELKDQVKQTMKNYYVRSER